MLHRPVEPCAMLCSDMPSLRLALNSRAFRWVQKIMPHPNEYLVSLWQEHGITGDLRRKLEDILIEHGKEASLAATEAVVIAIKEVNGRYMSRSYYRSR